MHPKRRVNAVALLGLVFFLAACGSSAAESVASAAAQSEVPPTLPLVAAPSPAPVLAPAPTATQVPVATEPLAFPTQVPVATEPLAFPTQVPVASEPLAFPTPEPWQPAATQPQPTGEGSAPEPAAAETSSSPATEDPEAGAQIPSGPTYDLGTCLGSLASQEAATVVPCDQPHLVEVYHVGVFAEAPGSPHPGEQMLAVAMEQCAPSFEALPGVAQSGESFEVQVHGPSRGQWDNGERFLACLLVFPEPVDQPLTEIDRTVPPANLGDCFSGADVDSLVPISCQEPHEFEVYATTGVLELDAAEDFCRRALGNEALFVDFNQVWNADVVVGDTQVDCYLSSLEPTTGSVFDEPADDA